MISPSVSFRRGRSGLPDPQPNYVSNRPLGPESLFRSTATWPPEPLATSISLLPTSKQTFLALPVLSPTRFSPNIQSP
jgi:hypothetical protein